MGTSSLFNIGVGGIPVYRLEDRQEVDLHSYWLELGGAINLGHGRPFLHYCEGILFSYGLVLCIEDVTP